MVESRDEALHARVRELEGRVEQLAGLLGELTEDVERHARPAEPAERAESALRSPAGWAAAAGIGEPRFPAALDTVYQARTFGYVSVYFVTGRTARVRLLVGPQSPPTTVVGHVADGHLGGVVRPGEFWMAATHKPGLRTGFECVFTPLF
ncbi:hypothetical protein [Saccharothrix texasensis]|uniref:Uncharacterized protein n=1 Tax=Saccharothrix texasensis TaxID=103734 RepID=A0A3N1H2T4_9PSEU|nr:hypothetical protein [Saccharothrix texasensis]ROP36821.1 hypothetical protein EDD40_2100 [Saccharothrix texasensis]